MLFTINDLGFSIAGLLLEGWLAFAARCVCALALLFIGWVVSRWLQKSLFPRLLKRSWHFAFTHPLLESFARPAARIAWYTGMYLALRSLPWAIPGLAALLLKVYRMMLVFLIGTGFYHASGIAALLLASSSEEVRTNRTLLTLLDKVYKVAVVVLCGATIAQESGLPVGSVVASAGLIGLTISLAAQDMAKNFFSGVVILLDKPFSIGDWITVGDVEGEVVDINFRSTKVRAVDNSIYILTNSTVSSATINNATLRNKRLYRFTLGVTYDTTRPQLEKLMADLDAMLKASPDTYEDTAFVRMTGFGDSSINLMVSAYLRTADLGAFLRMQNDLNLNIMDVMKADGAHFPPRQSTSQKRTDSKKADAAASAFLLQRNIQRHHEGEPQHYADDARRFVLLHGFRYHLLSRHADHTPGGGAHEPRQSRAHPAREGQRQQRPQRLHEARRSTGAEGFPSPLPGLHQRQAHRRAFRDILQADAQCKGQRPADGLRLTLQGQRRRKSHHHALGQIVESHGQHHPAHPAMLF